MPLVSTRGAASARASGFLSAQGVIVGSLFAWGTNTEGELGILNFTNYSSPKQVGSVSTWKDIRAGKYFSAAISKEGALWTWGSNIKGELGLTLPTGAGQYKSSPAQVGSLTTWLNVAAGAYHVVATQTNGTLWAWGWNANGQIGQGTGVANYYSSPKQVGALTTWLKVGAGAYHSAAIKADGTLWTWGRGDFGQLGRGNTTNYSSPVQVGALTDWLSVVGGRYFTVATKSDGTIWSWGDNLAGQLGHGNTTNYSSPKQVGALTTWSSASTGRYATLAIQTNGTMWSWGNNSNGQLGITSAIVSFSTPQQIGTLTTWLQTSAGFYHGAALRSDGTAWTWGLNTTGQLGQNDTTQQSSPVQVGTLTTWNEVAAGSFWTMGLRT